MNIIGFITVIAWVFGIWSTVFVVARIVAGRAYQTNTLKQIRDKMDGIQRSFPWMKAAIIAIVCWAWILTQ